jgi:uridine kinase
VFVSTAGDECLRRRLERDIAERGRTRECVLRQYEETVWPMAQCFVLPSREFADLVVSGEEPLDKSVAQVVAQARVGTSCDTSAETPACGSFGSLGAAATSVRAASARTNLPEPEGGGH